MISSWVYRLLLVSFLIASVMDFSFCGETQKIEPDGLTIKSVPEDSVLKRLGVKPADTFYRWERLPNSPINLKGTKGDFNSPFDWLYLMVEQFPRGEILIYGTRAGSEIEISFPMTLSSLPFPNFTTPRKSKSKDKRLESWAKYQQAVIYRQAGNLDHSINIALSEINTLNDNDYIKKFFVSKACSTLIDKGCTDQAAELALRASEIIYKTGDDELYLADLYHLAGNSYLRSKNIEKAELNYLKSLEIRLNSTSRDIILADSFNNLGLTYLYKGNIDKAKTFAEQSVFIRRFYSPSSPLTANSLMNRSIIDFEQGRFAEAELKLIEALNILQPYDNKSNIYLSCLNNLGNILNDRGEYNKAEVIQIELENKLQNNPINKQILNSVYNGNGIRLVNQEKYKEAEHYYLKALELLDNNNPFITEKATTLINLSDISLRRKNFQKAITYALTGIEHINKHLPRSSYLATLKYNYSIALAKLGKINDAISTIKESMEIFLDISPLSSNTANCLLKLGEFHKLKGDILSYEKYCSLSLTSLSNHLDYISSSYETNTAFKQKHDHIYKKNININIQKNDFATAINNIERYRGYYYVKMLNRKSNTSPAFQKRHILDELKTTSTMYEKALQKKQSVKSKPIPTKEPQSDLSRIRLMHDQFKAQIHKTNPRFSSVKPLNLEQIINELDPYTAILSYSILEDKLVLFTIRKNTKLKTYIIEQPESYWANKITMLLDKSFQSYSKLFFPSFRERSSELFDNLIGPAINDIADAHRLVIIPDGPLHKLPFALLYDQANDEYLIEKKPITTTISATVYAELRHRPRRELKRIVAIGDPVYPNEGKMLDPVIRNLDVPRGIIAKKMQDYERQSPDDVLDALLDYQGHKGMDSIVRSQMTRQGRWSRLPQTAREVERIQQLFGDSVEVYLREEASESLIKSLGPDTDILHIAAHAFVDNFRALDSGLVLTINEDFQKGEENGILHAWEIIERMHLDAELVVLSACQTGLGKDTGGEGLIGLTHAFHFAGARTILASYWNVNDVTTAVLMERFYGYLKEGFDKSTALQKAQIDFIRFSVDINPGTWFGPMLLERELDASHPYFWAGFQLIGPWD